MTNLVLKMSFFCGTTGTTLLAFLLTAAGIWYSLELKHLKNSINFEHEIDTNISAEEIPYILLSIGALGFLITSFGFCSSPVSRRTIISYNVCGFILIHCLVACGVVGIVLGKTYFEEQHLTSTFKFGFKAFKNHENNVTKFSLLESKLHCCGVEGAVDYWRKGVEYPHSCYDGRTNDKILNKVGCVQAFMLAAAANGNHNYMLGSLACSGLGVLVFLCMILSLKLAHRMETKDYGEVDSTTSSCF